MKEPMLAATIKDVHALKYPLLVSPKLDGIRAVVDKKLLTRSMKLVPNTYTQKLFGCETLQGMDGELVVGNPVDPAVFNITQSGVMAKAGKPAVRFYVFDYFIKPPKMKTHEPYEERANRIQQYAYDCRKEFDGARFQYWQQVQVEDPERFLWLMETWTAAGYEGAMARSLTGGYKFGRSTLKEGWLMKLKLFEDSEAVILGFVEKMTNLNEQKKGRNGRNKRAHIRENLVPAGTLGALEVQDVKSGVKSNIGVGFSDALAQEIWDNQRKYKRKIVKYKFQPAGVKEKPRFPTFLAFRSKLDM